MLKIKSSFTGQTLFSLNADEGSVYMSPEAVRTLLETLGNSELGRFISVTNPSTGAKTAMSCMLGGSAGQHPFVIPFPSVRASHVLRDAERTRPNEEKSNDN